MKYLHIVFFCLVFVFAKLSLMAQPGPPPDPEDNPVPITGIEYLITAGAAFGAKKIYDKKKSK